ncbi:MAG: Rieske (2Fe-2S) protein, partial [Bacteroidota bacterium]
KASKADTSQFVKVAPPAEFIDGRAKMIVSGKENIAIFRNGNAYSAISNVCKHQNGPLGEGKIVNGCVVCPWHGYEYQPFDGCSPPPFTEKVSTYDLKLEDGHIWVKLLPHPEGTYVEPLTVQA